MTPSASPRGRGAAIPFAAPLAAMPANPEILPYATAAAIIAPADDPDARDCAVASVVCGLLFCLAPFVTGALSVVFGLTVLRHARRLPAAVTATALFGTLLGLANVGFWTMLFIY